MGIESVALVDVSGALPGRWPVTPTDDWEEEAARGYGYLLRQRS